MSIYLSHGDTALKERLHQAKKTPVHISENTLENIITALKRGDVSRKAVCSVYGLTYPQLKAAISNHRSH